MSLGGDQGGSIRIPACWTGIYGLKPTHGLVPYTGIFPIEMTLDHIGPMAANVTDVAILLSVIAGVDGYDPRQVNVITQDYLDSLDKGVEGMTIGLLKEGFNLQESESDVDECVAQAIWRFQSLGAKVTEISLPTHGDGIHLWNVIAIEGATEQMVKGNAFGNNWQGYYITSLLDAYARGWRSRPDNLSETVKTVMLLGEYMYRNYNGRYYAKAQNLRHLLVQDYDTALTQVDLLALPTTPLQAKPLPAPDCSREEYWQLALGMLANTAPFNLGGHPAINVPCGMRNGLPVGMMLVGKRWDESTILRAAKVFEDIGNWKDM